MMKKQRLEEYFISNHTELYNRMKNCDHGYEGSPNPYHLEGTVWNHTQMVLDIFGPETNSTLLVAALLHDIGKLFVRMINGDKVWFKGHTGRGTMEAIDIIKDIKENLDDFSDINIVYALNLISMHHLFFNYLSSEITEKLVKKLYEKLKYFDYEFIYLLQKLCLADCKGRITDIDSNYGRLVRLFSMINFLYYSTNWNLNNDNKWTNKVVFNVGIPYAGKSYNSTKYKENYVIISRDDLIIEKFKHCTYDEAWKLVDHNAINTELLEHLKKAIHNKENIVIDMTNLNRKSRNIKRCLFPSSYKKVANVYYTGLETIRNRRKASVGKYIPWNIIEKMMSSYSIPLYDEFDEINFIVDHKKKERNIIR